MKTKYILTVFIMVFFSVLNLFSIQLKHSDNAIIENASFDEDYIFTGKELTFTGLADDMFFAGENLIFSGKTSSSMFGIGDKIILNGDIGNNLYSAGTSIDINGIIDDTVFMAGETITINKNSKINGTVFAAGRNIKILGEINGNLIIGAGNITIDGKINGDVKAFAGNIHIKENGIISGDFDYKSDTKISNNEESKITGEITFKELKHPRKEEFKNFKESFKIAAFVLFKLFLLLSFITGALLILLFPITKKLETERSTKNFWFSCLWGLIPLLIYPVIIILLIGFVITIPLAAILALAGLPILFLTKIFGITMFGQFLFKAFKWNNNRRFLYFLFGLIFYSITYLIPGLGFLSMIFFSSLGWGFLLEQLFNKKLSD